MLKDGEFALSQLPEKFHFALNKPEALRTLVPSLAAYISRKYRAYGYKDDKALIYNPEYKPTDLPFDVDRYRWVEHPESGLRHVGKSSDIVRLDYTGWYVDNFQSETCNGEVYQLPARNHEPQYAPAVSDPWGNDAALFDFGHVTNDKEDCARMADDMARTFADHEREFQAKEDLKNRIEEIAGETKTLYRDFRNISRTLRKLPKTDAKNLIAREWNRTRENIETLRAEQRKIEREGIEY